MITLVTVSSYSLAISLSVLFSPRQQIVQTPLSLTAAWLHMTKTVATVAFEQVMKSRELKHAQTINSKLLLLAISSLVILGFLVNDS